MANFTPFLAGHDCGIVVTLPTAYIEGQKAKVYARVAELVDALDLGSSAARCGGSSPPFRTIIMLLKRNFEKLSREFQNMTSVITRNVINNIIYSDY